MRALLSTIGSRGDVQPLLALAIQLRAALERALQPEIAKRVLDTSKAVRSDGALAAAERLLST